jgi:hypothetical protein
LIFGAMQAVMIKLTDPSLHEPVFTWTPVLIAVWIIAATSLTLGAFWRDWLSVFGRILGSWLLAIGLLYGGASLVPKPRPPSPTSLPGSSGPLPGSSRTIPGLPEPDEGRPGGIDRFKQP